MKLKTFDRSDEGEASRGMVPFHLEPGLKRLVAIVKHSRDTSESVLLSKQEYTFYSNHDTGDRDRLDVRCAPEHLFLLAPGELILVIYDVLPTGLTTVCKTVDIRAVEGQTLFELPPDASSVSQVDVCGHTLSVHDWNVGNHDGLAGKPGVCLLKAKLGPSATVTIHYRGKPEPGVLHGSEETQTLERVVAKTFDMPPDVAKDVVLHGQEGVQTPEQAATDVLDGDTAAEFSSYWSFDEPIFVRTFNLHYCSPEEYVGRIRDDGYRGPESNLDGCDGQMTWFNPKDTSKDTRYHIWIRPVPDLPKALREVDPIFLGTLHHEANHAAMSVLQGKDIDFANGEQETLAYYAEFVFRRILVSLKQRAHQESPAPWEPRKTPEFKRKSRLPVFLGGDEFKLVGSTSWTRVPGSDIAVIDAAEVQTELIQWYLTTKCVGGVTGEFRLFNKTLGVQIGMVASTSATQPNVIVCRGIPLFSGICGFEFQCRCTTSPSDERNGVSGFASAIDVE